MSRTSPPPSKTKKTITVLRTGEPVPWVLERRGQFHDLIAASIGPAFTGDYEVIDVRSEPFPDPRGTSAFVITGSASNVPTREPWMLRTEAFLRDVVAAGTPTFGICFGHQILAQALGGEVHKNPRGREIGTLRIERIERAIDDPILDGIPPVFEANVTHLDSVARLPEGAVSLARSSLEDHHAIRFSERCYGVQFHPEIDAEVMRAYVESRQTTLRDEGFSVEQMLAAIHDGEEGRRALRNFVARFL
ncbi:MAG: glutamine amidotransferase [Minicystis sp.]